MKPKFPGDASFHPRDLSDYDLLQWAARCTNRYGIQHIARMTDINEMRALLIESACINQEVRRRLVVQLNLNEDLMHLMKLREPTS